VGSKNEQEKKRKIGQGAAAALEWTRVPECVCEPAAANGAIRGEEQGEGPLTKTGRGR